MRTINLTWDIPTTREGGVQSLPKSEIANVEVLVKTGTAAFARLALVTSEATQTVEKDMPDGVYTFRFIVTDIFGNVGKPTDVNATIKSAAPGQVTNIKITVS